MKGVILLVDDSDADRMLLRRAFKKAGVDNPVVEAAEVDEAKEYLKGTGKYADRERYPLPCLVITDLKMPGADGFELLGWIASQEELRRIPKLVFSDSAEETDRKRARVLGVCEYFVKPAEIAAMAAVVRIIDEEWIAQHCEV